MTGLGLSVACGFRVFVPPLVVSIAAQTGTLELTEGLAWLGEWPALIALSIATVGDVIAHEFPVVDDVLNVVEAPLVPIAATILSVSLLTDMDPLLKWGLAAIAGGGSAGALHVARSFLKSLLNASTAGVSTPVVSLVEDAAALVTPILVILAPVFVLFLFLVVVGVTALALKKWMGKRRQASA